MLCMPKRNERIVPSLKKDISNKKRSSLIITSKNSEDLAKRMKTLSAEILQRNQNLYKRLENR